MNQPEQPAADPAQLLEQLAELLATALAPKLGPFSLTDWGFFARSS
jgi:hypothetical protein